MATDLENIFYKETTVRSGVGCTIEYNMNSLIDGITVVATKTSSSVDSLDAQYIAGIDKWDKTKQANPFKKLFPIDSIIKSFRPIYPGVKYFISSTVDTPVNSFLPFRTLAYTGEGKNSISTGAKPRVYYPGVTTSYKYWISPKGGSIDLTVKYKQDTAISGNKLALVNKIVLKFEKYHSIPANYKITLIKSDDSSVVIGPVTLSDNSSGSIIAYLSGGSWLYVDGIAGIPDGTILDNPISIKSMRLEATKRADDKYIGVIEFSARWLKDISEDIENININKESSSSENDLLPVGVVTANFIELSIAKYNQSSLKISEYIRDSNSFDSDLIYLYKNAELVPYFKIYHTTGNLGSGDNKYYKVKQGVYYVDNFSIDQFGSSIVTALDSSKFLMETLCPDLLCESFPVTAIIRNLLDSVGYTNYNFNLATTETSIPQINYWWTKDTNTVWQAIQELCRDIQMNAFLDDDNILQFYSRDYIYNTSRSVDWSFYYDKEGSDILSNIIQFTKREIASANSVKILWQSPLSSIYTGTSTFLWQSPTAYLSAGALANPASRPNGPALIDSDEEFIIDIYNTDSNFQQKAFYNYNGYILIDSEIIEFDAIGYDLTPLDDTGKINVWVTSSTDVNKYRALAKPGYSDTNDLSTAYFQPNGRYRIKKTDGVISGRGALGTVKANHMSATEKLNGWTGRVLSWS